MSYYGLVPAVPWAMRLGVWWHRKRNPGHHSLLLRVPLYDPPGDGYLVRCTGCDRTWCQ